MARRRARAGGDVTVAAGRVRKQRCVTCRSSEWRAIGKRARAADMDVSSYILSRVLDGEAPDGPPHPEAGYPMALTGAEQRRQLEILESCTAGCGPLTAAPLVPGHGMTVGRAVNFLIRTLDPDWGGPAVRSAGGRETDPEPGPATEPSPEPETQATDLAGAGHAANSSPRQHPCFGPGPDPGFSGGFRVSGSRFCTPLSTGGRRAGMPGRSGRGGAAGRLALSGHGGPPRDAARTAVSRRRVPCGPPTCAGRGAGRSRSPRARP